jgi:pyrroloquinoline quinone (PQQ) biosynthesis protein C
MSFYQHLTATTRDDRDFLMSAPVIQETLAGQITLPRYHSFLAQAFHHVRHTVPLLMIAGGRLPERYRRLQPAFLHYLNEEVGHDEWILNDIGAAGGDPEAVRRSIPHPETDALVAYVYDTVQRRNPLGIFGMVFVLEGTSVALALKAADRIQATLKLPDEAFTYLRSHGTLDQQHVRDLEQILAQITDPGDQADIGQCARAMFWLYGHMFRSLDRCRAVPPADAARKIA